MTAHGTGKRIAFAGAGLSAAVIARDLAEKGHSCVLFEKRRHIAGNCFTERDAETGVMVHQYGPHIFHTSNERVWTYVNRFAEFGPFVNRVRAVTPRGVFSLPINLLTLNQFFGKAMNPAEAAAFVEEKARPFRTGKESNFEEVALSLVGEEIYRNFFHGYTRKQWGCEPAALPGSVIKRLPLRFNYEDDYYSDTFQGIPREGYTAMIAAILDHPGIEVRLGTPLDPRPAPEFDHTVWTGPIDSFFGFRHGRLSYRTVSWENARQDGDALGVACLNFTGPEVPHTRRVEHKHFAPWERHAKTFVSTEFSRATGPEDDPFYPVRLPDDLQKLRLYLGEAKAAAGVSFVGRLGTYRYLDMHLIIEESLNFAEKALAALHGGGSLPLFPVDEAKLLA